MTALTPFAVSHKITPAERLARPEAPEMRMIRWIETQGQDVWGRAILGAELGDGDGLEGEARFLLWLVDQKLDLANAIRLFWKLYVPDVLLPGKDTDPVRAAALKAILTRHSVGGYPMGRIGLGRAEARYYRKLWHEGRARREGVTLPKAFLSPQPGRALEDAPAIRPVGPAPDWMDTPLEADFALTGRELRRMAGEGARAQEARMRAHLREGRRDATWRYTAAGGMAAAAAWIYVSGVHMGALLG